MRAPAIPVSIPAVLACPALNLPASPTSHLLITTLTGIIPYRLICQTAIANIVDGVNTPTVLNVCA